MPRRGGWQGPAGGTESLGLDVEPPWSRAALGIQPRQRPTNFTTWPCCSRQLDVTSALDRHTNSKRKPLATGPAHQTRNVGTSDPRSQLVVRLLLLLLARAGAPSAARAVVLGYDGGAG